LPVDRSTYYDRSKRPGQAVVMKRIKEIAETAWAKATGAFMWCCAARVGW
jgi:hypothetical protein